jgi:AhpD family alkylhydroperoxidase
MLEWNSYLEDLLERAGELGDLSPDTVRGLITLDQAAAKTDELGPKVCALIALAVAVTIRCDSSIAVYSKVAVVHGATREEIAEALGVAVALNAGAAATCSARVLDTVANLPK